MDREAAIDHRIAELAARQGGVVSRKQLYALGLSAAAIDMRIRRGRLHRIHQAVYAVGHRLVSARGRRFAALLAVDGSVLGYTSAGAVWDQCEEVGARIHVVVVGDAGRDRRPGIAVHRCRLAPDEITRRDGLVLTTRERTIVDLASILDITALEQCLVRAVASRRFDVRALERAMARAQRRPGVGVLRELLIEWDGRSAPARSVLEARFLDLARRAHLPRPVVNGRFEGLEVDFAWPDRRVIVEVDGYAFHGGLAAFERDRARDATLALAGWRVLRFSWRQVVGEPARVAEVVERALASSMAGSRS